MEIAKVDVRKLQMLNDRINQTIDALNQVRLSVHGISHTGAPQGVPYASPFLGNAWGSPAYLPPGFAPGIYGGQTAGYPFASQFGGIPGISHTSPANYTSPYAYGTINPMYPSTYGTGTGFVGGLSHTSPESIDPSSFGRPGYGMDSFYTQRWTQTFPFAQWGYSPFGASSL